MSEKREFPPRIRSSAHVRDARLIIIATEGTKTEKKYFKDLVSPEFYRNSRVHVEVLDQINTESSPDDVIKTLNSFVREYKIRKSDELWLVIDRDRWGDAKLANITRQCHQKRYEAAVSNPCFEIWLLLHLRNINEYPKNVLVEFKENKKDNTKRTRLERELVAVCGSYNKSNPDSRIFLPHIEKAISRAEELDIEPDSRWPQELGSRVYRLVLRIINN